jgi:hypothetical protein
MKKYNILFSLIMLLSTSTYSQVKVGANLLPGISTNRISSDSDTISFSNDGVGYRIALGVLFDFETRKNYYFSTGIYWFPKRIGIKAGSSEGVNEQSFNIQYLQIPFNLKLLTDEFSIDKWFFFQFGIAFDMKIDESGKYSEDVYIEKFNFWDIVLNFGVGIEMNLSQNTTLFSGVTYYRGLLNAVKPQSFLQNELTVKNDYWALSLGVKF